MVLVQPSCYGSDNRCTLEALAALGARGRAVVAVAPDVATQSCAACTIWRVRHPSERSGRQHAFRSRIEEHRPSAAATGWHVQTFLPKGRLAELADDLLPPD